MDVCRAPGFSVEAGNFRLDHLARAVAAENGRILEHLPPSRIVASTNCGMVPLPRAAAEAKFTALGAGTALARSRL